MKALVSGYGRVAALFDLVDGRLKGQKFIDLGERASLSIVSGDTIFTVNELNRYNLGECGRISSYHLDRETEEVELISTIDAEDDPCSISLSPNRKYLVVTNYSSSSVEILKIEEDDRLRKATHLVLAGKGVNELRQEKSHPHASLFLDGKLYITDLGTDKLYSFDFDEENGKISGGKIVSFEKGNGPRLVKYDLNEDELVVISELGNTVRAFDRSTLKMKRCFSTTEEDKSDAAHLEITKDSYLCSNRGAETVAVINKLTGERRDISTPLWPRFFGLEGKYLYMLGERSDEIVLYDLKKDEEVERLSFPSPTSIFFFN